MDTSKSIALVLAMVALLATVYAADAAFGPRPEIDAGKIAAWALFIAAAVYLIRVGYLRWQQTQEEAHEYEQSFLAEVEQELQSRAATATVPTDDNPAAPGAVTTHSDPAEPDAAFAHSNLAAPGVGASGVPPEFSNSDPEANRLGSSVAPEPIPSHLQMSRAESSIAPEAQHSQPQPDPSPTPPQDPSSIPGMPDFAPPVQKLVNDLKRLNVIAAYEGKVDLPPPSPPAPIYRLRAGGLLLILDELPSHRFLAHQSRRFRAIVAADPQGEPIVVRRYQEFIADELEGPTEGRS